MKVFQKGTKVRFTQEFAKEFQKGLDRDLPQEGLSIKQFPYNSKHTWTVDAAEDGGYFTCYTLRRGSEKMSWIDSGQLEEA